MHVWNCSLKIWNCFSLFCQYEEINTLFECRKYLQSHGEINFFRIYSGHFCILWLNFYYVKALHENWNILSCSRTYIPAVSSATYNWKLSFLRLKHPVILLHGSDFLITWKYLDIAQYFQFSLGYLVSHRSNMILQIFYFISLFK